MALVLALLLSAFPSNSRVSWMRLESFHLIIGMTRDEMVNVIAPWNPKFGKDKNEIVIDYNGDKALTLELKNDRLRSVRFEFFALLPEIRKAFDEEKTYLRGARGTPRKSTSSILIYDDALPNVMAVVKDDPSSEQARKGLGVLAVRYYDPR
ncbi:MAG: hypothetical protein DMF56_07195 [Acidobacteria bacterium]|nr:MAG: hypothetical protein DMF56_07195 [Acidobacteriota bacterium]